MLAAKQRGLWVSQILPLQHKAPSLPQTQTSAFRTPKNAWNVVEPDSPWAPEDRGETHRLCASRLDHSLERSLLDL